MDPRYPIGPYVPQPYSDALKEEWLADIRFLPALVENAVSNLDEQQLQTPYRAGGWTVHQVVHHLADSHMNAYIRFKLGYTESSPVIKPYDEKQWAATADVQSLPVNISITLLHALHMRLHEFLLHFTAADWEKTIIHPAHDKPLSLWVLLGMYAWHGRHHTAHILRIREALGWG